MNNKQVRLFFAYAILVVVLFALAVIKQFFFKTSTNTNDFSASFKEAYLEGTDVEHLDSISGIYSNYKYNFSMDFPDNWEIDRGVSEHSIIRGGQLDSATSFTINVIEIEDIKDADYTIWDLWDNKSTGLEQSFYNMLSKSVNSRIHNYQPRKVYVSNFEGIEVKFDYVVREVDVEIDMQCVFYSVYILPYTYTIGLHVPKVYYDENPVKYKYLINHFQFLNPVKQ